MRFVETLVQETLVQKWPNASIKAALHAVYLNFAAVLFWVSNAWGILEGNDNQRLQQNSSKHSRGVHLGFPAHSRPLTRSPTAKPYRNGDEQISFNKGCLQATSQPLHDLHFSFRSFLFQSNLMKPFQSKKNLPME